MAVNAEKNQQDQQNNMGVQPGTSQGPTSGGATTQPASRVANYSSGASPAGTTGSGRFTNLSKYLGANEGAGDRLASGIGSNLEKQTAFQKRETNTQAGDVRAGIEAAQNKLNTGNQLLGQTKASDFNAQNIAGDQAKLQDFTQFRTNQAVGADALGQQAGQAQTTAQNLQAQQQQQLQNASTEQGRFNLLKNAFGGGTVYQNPYSTGQQKLDQLFLQAGGANNINNLQNQVRSGLNETGQVLNTLGQNASTIGDISTQAKGLAQGLQDQTNALTSGVVSNLEGRLGDVNTQRASDQNWANEQYGKLQRGETIDPRFAQMLGLQSGQNLYNVIPGTTTGSFLNINPEMADTASDIASQEDVNRYQAYAKLAGIDPTSYQLTQAGNLGAAVTARQGQDSLGSALGRSQQELLNNAAVSGRGETPSFSGAGQTASVSADSLMAANLFDKYGITNIDQLNSRLRDPQGLYGTVNNALTNEFFGAYPESGSVQQAYALAREDALRNALNNLNNYGYFNRVKIGT